MINRILGSLLLLFSYVWAGTVTATVDTTEVLEGDTVLLTLAITGKKVDAIPDIKEIGGCEVLNTQRRSTTNFVHLNGVSSMEKTQILMMEFRPEANMTIPSFGVKVDGKIEQSNPILLKVIKSATGMKRQTKDFSLEMRVPKRKFYLGESIVLSLYFKQRSSVDVMQVEYTPPAFKDFFSKQIGEGKTYRKGAFTIQELNYLLIAKRAGNLTLEPARIKIAQRSRERQEGGWYIDVPRWTKISSDALKLEIIAPKKAHDIVGKYKLLEQIDTQKVKANKPVTLKVELIGKGALDDYEGIEFKIPSVTIYSDKAKIETNLMGKSLQSRYQKSFVFIAEHNFTIPSQEIRVYDYEKGEVEVLRTKSYRIEVEEQPKSINSTLVHRATDSKSQHKKRGIDNIGSLALLLAFILGVLVMLFICYLRKFNFMPLKASVVKNEEALKILYPKMSQSKEIEAMVEKLYAVKRGDRSVKIDKAALKNLLERYSN